MNNSLENKNILIAGGSSGIELVIAKFTQGRLASPKEIAQAYLCLMLNDYITGTIMVVDGGAGLI